MAYKWLRSNMDFFRINSTSSTVVVINNGSSLDEAFYRYANNFFEAADTVMHYLIVDASKRLDIAKLDLWYFAMIYLYRQSLELLIKAAIFQTVSDQEERKNIVGEIRHDLRQGFEKMMEKKNIDFKGNKNGRWVYKFLTDISRLDRESDMFRYPFGANFRELFSKQTNICLLSTYANMNRAYQLLKEIYDCGTISDNEFEEHSPKLIIEGGEYYYRSVVGYKYAQFSFYPYFSSYRNVAGFLKNLIVVHQKNALFMPMCYLYRNAVELGLKRLIVEKSSIDATKALKIIKKKKHSILVLWNSIKDEIRACVNPSDDDSTLNNAQQYIEKFHGFDAGSDLFRYPCNKNLDMYFEKDKKFDVENVSSCFEELCNFLDCTDAILEEVRDYEAEMASYYDF